MQAAFFKLADVMPLDKAVKLLKQSIKKTYGLKGDKIVKMNQAAVDAGCESIHKVTVPKDWADAKDKPAKKVDM